MTNNRSASTLISRLLTTWSTLTRVSHSSKIVHSSIIDLFECEFKNYEPLLNIVSGFKHPFNFPNHCFKSLQVSLPSFSLSFSTFIFVQWNWFFELAGDER